MDSGHNDVDFSMSEIKRAISDIHSFMHALASRLTLGLPAGMLKITKKKKLLSSRETVQSIAVTANDKTFVISIENDQLVATINKQVNNIVLSHKKCSVPEWFSTLQEELKSVAGYHAEAAELLSDFLV